MNEMSSHDAWIPSGKRRAVGDDVLGLLECPLTRQPLEWASDAVLGRLELLRKQGRLLDRSGAPMVSELHAGLVNREGSVFYPVSNGLPVILKERSVALS
jgi:uncharacterized protein YbaR (Trm112 family)